MSTFAVFGMTRAMAVAEARKKTPATRADKSRGGVEPIPLDEWLGMVEAAAGRIMSGTQVRQLSPMFDAPQYAEQFIALARKAGDCRDMRIRAKSELKDATGETIIDPKTKAPKYGFTDWASRGESAA